MPPEGKLEASGSAWISCEPVKISMAPPLLSKVQAMGVVSLDPW